MYRGIRGMSYVLDISMSNTILKQYKKYIKNSSGNKYLYIKIQRGIPRCESQLHTNYTTQNFFQEPYLGKIT